ncbi:type II toxin-antitoxin system RelE/ParE family toxin [Pseudomonas syringae]|uniref:type II toxin-antitoxin system RelE/ParE family toxin n=1 Tax=Pseudomonas syringae TaxID=317 RepID=UPI0003FFD568|nr:type II toxin-antitoxin system RelE/ParE family toxin [Pseudomonas syringae]
MTRNIVILESAKDDFKEIKIYGHSEFGDSIWKTVNAEYKAAFKDIQKNPEHGTDIEELKQLGFFNIKSRLVRQTRVIYEFDDATVYVRILISTKRDFGRHLMKRVLSQKI